MPNPKSPDARKEFNMAVTFTCIGAVLAVAGVAASIAGSSDGTTITVFWGAILTGAIMIGYSLIGFVRAFQIIRGKVGENGELPIDVALKKASFLRILILAVLMTLVLFVIAYLILDPENKRKRYFRHPSGNLTPVTHFTATALSNLPGNFASSRSNTLL